MAHLPATAIVIPCYNEERRLDLEEFQRFIAHHYPKGVFLFVDDGSTDGTFCLLERLRRNCPGAVSLCRLPHNQGKAEAVRQGVLQALRSGAEYVGFWDADLATPLEAIAVFREFLMARPDIEVVFGARVQLLGRAIERRALRHYLGRVFSTVVSVMLRLAVYDTQCGAKLFRASPQLLEIFAAPFSTRWLFDVEIIARLLQAHRAGRLRPVAEIIYEYPLLRWRDVGGSKLRARDFCIAAFDLFRIYWRYLRPRRGSCAARGGVR